MNPISKLLNSIRGKIAAGLTRIRELGGYHASFSPFGADMYASDLVRSCIRVLADQTAKGNPVVTGSGNEALQRILKYRPNQYMNGKDFLYKVRTIYEIKNTAFILVTRNDLGEANGFYPIPYQNFEALMDAKENIYIKFRTCNGEYVLPWEDLVVLRKDYNQSDISGDDNAPILDTLELIKTSNDSIANAVKTTASLRGIIKSTKAMVDPKDVKKMKDTFVKDYMDPATGDGIGALDASMDFVQTNIQPTVASWEQLKEFRENVFRYFGVNDKVLQSVATPQEMQTFYELKVEPFLLALSLEMTSKVFTERQRSFGNGIKYDSSTIQFMSMQEKLSLQAVVDRGAMTINEWRAVLNLPEVEGGDVFVRRLDTAQVDQEEENQEEEVDE